MFACAVACVTGTKRNGRVFLEADIFEKKTKVLYDTGADVSCIDDKEFRKIPSKQRPEKNAYSQDRRFESASGDDLEVKGVINLPITINGRNVTHPFYVVKNLSDPVILGADFIHAHKLCYCPVDRNFFWKNKQDWSNGIAALTSTCVLPAFSVCNVRVNLLTDNGDRPSPDCPILLNVQAKDAPLIVGGPGLITSNPNGQAVIELRNCGPEPQELPRNHVIGVLDNATSYTMEEIKPDVINAIVDKKIHEEKNLPLDPEMEKFIEENARINVPDQYQELYMELLKKNHAVFSRNKTDLGRSDFIQHEIHLKTNEPVYVKQFKMPDVHRDYLEVQVKEWLKLGIVQPTRSRYNSPMFLVDKKDGGYRVVQDFRALNSNSHVDKYTMKDVSECIGEIGRSNSTIFSTLDLTSGFWQMLLQPKSRPYTAFTIPGMGQFQWVTSAMGLLGCPSTFQRLVEAVVEGITNIIVYIDDLIVHSNNHEDHIKTLSDLFTRLHAHNLKVNLKKCVFGSKDVMYLGFHLTESGIKPGVDKLKAVGQTNPPANVHEIRQFLGLCNFFRTHVRNFAQISSPLTALTRKDSPWKTGPLPEDALKAFRELQSILVSEPVVDYPRRNRDYALITDAALGDDKHDGGLGAILTQLNEQGEHCVIAYASRKLQKHEKNYTPFLLEMQAAIWGMDHFSNYLKGRHFTLYTDHKPLEKLGKVHTRTLNRLQEIMNTFDFEIVYKKGSEMPADFLSRNVVASINFENVELAAQQQKDDFLAAMRNFLLHKILPKDENVARTIVHLSHEVFIENDVLWRRLRVRHEPGRVVVLLPRAMVEAVLEEAHGHLLTGHDGIGKTKERIMQSFWWPQMDKDIIEHLQKCQKCQKRRIDHRAPPQLLSPLPQCTEPNQRIHADLFGPLRTSGNSKKFILCITDAFTKYVELVALPDKEALTVTSAIFNRWICRYGMPLELVTDQGREFANKMSDELYSLLKMKHQTTSARHPQCNAAAEVCNKTIAKYLNSFVDETTLDWEMYLAPLMFCYNTSFHRSIKNTPYFLTYGMEPRLPSFPTPDLRRTFYGESEAAEMHQRLLLARKTAAENNSEATEKNKEYFDKTKNAEKHVFVPNQLVLLEEYNFLGRNTKLCPKWSGPHRIINLKGTHCVELLLLNNRKTIVNVDRIKPYFAEKQHFNDLFATTEIDASQTPAASTLPLTSQQQQPVLPHSSSTDAPTTLPSAALTARAPSPPPAPPAALPSQPAPPTGTPKKRGRPPKTRAPSLAPPTSAAPPAIPAQLPIQSQNKGGIIDVNDTRMTRSKTRLLNQNNNISAVLLKQVINDIKDDISGKLLLHKKLLLSRGKKNEENTLQPACKCATSSHSANCRKRAKTIKDLLALYKEEKRWSEHSFVIEPAELENIEESPPESDLDDTLNDSLDNTDNSLYTDASDENLPEDDRHQVQVPPPPPLFPDQAAAQLSPIPKPPPDRPHSPVSDQDLSGAADVHHRADLSATEEDLEAFHSLDTIDETIDQLFLNTSDRIRNAQTPEEKNILIQQFDENMVQIRDLYRFQEQQRQQQHLLHQQQQQQRQEQLRRDLQQPPSPQTPANQPGAASTPQGSLRRPRPSPAQEFDEFFLATPPPRHTRRHGDVENLPLPGRPLEYKPTKKK